MWMPQLKPTVQQLKPLANYLSTLASEVCSWFGESGYVCLYKHLTFLGFPSEETALPLPLLTGSGRVGWLVDGTPLRIGARGGALRPSLNRLLPVDCDDTPWARATPWFLMKDAVVKHISTLICILPSATQAHTRTYTVKHTCSPFPSKCIHTDVCTYVHAYTLTHRHTHLA